MRRGLFLAPVGFLKSPLDLSRALVIALRYSRRKRFHKGVCKPDIRYRRHCTAGHDDMRGDLILGKRQRYHDNVAPVREAPCTASGIVRRVRR